MIPEEYKTQVFKTAAQWQSGISHGLEIPAGGGITQKGTYYSRTLDSGIRACQWHRLALDADLPPGTALEISYYASDDENIKKKIEQLLHHKKKSTEQKINNLQNIVPWKGPAKNPPDMLLRGAAGRYLWLKLELSTLDKTRRPAVNRMQVYYPRLSYLGYLPAVYREDTHSSEFLERFLAVFQTMQESIEEEFDNVPTLLDPAAAPSQFIPWLSTWLGAVYDETWEEKPWRTFLLRAVELYKKKGTKKGLEDILEIYIGEKPCIIEKVHVTTGLRGTPQTNPGRNESGENLLLFPPPANTKTEIITTGGETREVFLADILYGESTYSFSVLIRPGALAGKSLTVIRRIIENWKPAHTCYCLAILQPWFYLDMHTYLGINTVLTKPSFVLDGSTLIARDTVLFDGGEPALNIKNSNNKGLKKENKEV